MRGYPYPNELKEKTINLRKRGYSLNEISSQIKIPKTTIHDWVANKIILSERAKTRIKKRIFAGILKANRKKRIKITKPIKWSRGLIRIVSSFLFDGYSKIRGCAYCSRNLSQINLLRKIIYKIFKLTPYFYITKKGILKIEYNSIEFKKYINKKKKELLNYILSAPNEEKRIFLQTFFDDEGCINFNKNSKRVRGYQHSKKILKLVISCYNDILRVVKCNYWD